MSNMHFAELYEPGLYRHTPNSAACTVSPRPDESAPPRYDIFVVPPPAGASR